MDLNHLPFPEVGWGYLPPHDQVFRAFRYCQEKYNPKKVLEIGFHLGHSTTYQLEIYKNASIVGVSPNQDGNPQDRIPDGQRLEQADLIRDKYDNRFKWLQGTTREQAQRLTKFPFDFNFALIDGHHSETNLTVDLHVVCTLLKIPAFLVDNYEQKQIKMVCGEFPIKRINTFSYEDSFKGKYRVNQMALFELT